MTTKLPWRVRVFLGGQGLSMLGDEVTGVALPLVAVVFLGASPVEMGVLVALQQAPAFVSPLFAGPLVDHLPRRGLLVFTEIGRAVLVATVPVLWLFDSVTFAVLAGISLALGVLKTIFDVALFAYLPDVVPTGQLIAANSGLQGVSQAAGVGGPGIGGLAIQFLGGPAALVADGLSYVVSALSFRFLTDGAPATVAAAERDGGAVRRYLRSVGAGFVTLWRLPAVRLITFVTAAFNFFLTEGMGVYAIFLIRELGLAPWAYGLALTVGAGGALVAMWALPRYSGADRVRPVLTGSLLFASLEMLLLSVTPAGGGIASVGFVIVATLANNAAVAVFMVVNAGLRQRILPRATIGSAFAAMRAITKGAMPLGALLGGLLATTGSLRLAVLAAGVGTLATALVFTWFRGMLPERLTEPAPTARVQSLAQDE